MRTKVSSDSRIALLDLLGTCILWGRFGVGELGDKFMLMAEPAYPDHRILKVVPTSCNLIYTFYNFLFINK